MAQTLTKRGERDYIRFARSLGKRIGAHARMIGDSSRTQDEYLSAQFDSDEAARMVKHIVQTVDNRHIAVIVATFSGCPAYINYRGR